jgi:hypothetical protein
VKWLLEQEARSLLTRLALVRPFGLNEVLVPAASFSPAARIAIDRFLSDGRNELRERISRYREWLCSDAGSAASGEEAQRRFAFLRLRFNIVLTQFDLFADVFTQRSEQPTGVWLAGLDVAAMDALELGNAFEAPPVICYLDRGHGAAIRRARTRLPGGSDNPVAIVRVPRERMVGSGVASSLVHEVGHQGAELLDLVNSVRPLLQGLQRTGGSERVAWWIWERWISEILADLWSIARVGVASTLGLMALVMLPRAFVFRASLDDPHPMPWIRVLLSCAIGQAFFPHPQWHTLARAWRTAYPLRSDLPEPTLRQIGVLCHTMPQLAELLVQHRPDSLAGPSLAEAFCVRERQPAQLQRIYQSTGHSFRRLRLLAPSLLFAVMGQARVDGQLSPEAESRLLSDLFTFWALRRDAAFVIAAAGSANAPAPVAV